MQNFNMSAVRGDTFDGVEFTLSKNGSPIDLTGAAIKADFKLGSKVGTPSITLTSGAGITIVNAAEGVFKIDPFLVAIKAGKYYSDIQITIGEVVKTYLTIEFTVEQDVTN